MSQAFDNDRPIYLQIVDLILIKVLTGEYPIGSKIPSVRDLAQQLKVNPNTLQKAFSELEKLNIIKVQRTNGRFVTEDNELIESLRDEQAYELTTSFLNKMKELNYSIEDTLDYIKNYNGEENE